MLIFKSLEGVKYNLTTRSEHIVGRHGSNLEIRNDDSVSRQHASIKIFAKEFELRVKLLDLGSKHNTFVNEGINSQTPISKEFPTLLNVHDRVRFGARLNIWTLEEDQFVICAPSLTTQNKTMMNKLMSKMNGTIVSEWSRNCTHLTLNEMQMEPQVVCALALGKPIVTFEYWKQLLAALTSKKEKPIPDYTEYIPPISNSHHTLEQFDFSINTARKSLFKNLQFLAFDKDQFTELSPMVEAAGGKVTNGTSCGMSLGTLSKNTIVLQAKDESQKKIMETCLDLLRKQKKRAVSEIEIGLSIAECSRDRYCNPSYNVETLLRQTTPILSNYDATVLVEDTQNLAEADTDIQEFGTCSNFSLTVNEQNKAMSECDDDDFVVQSSPPIVEDSSTTRSGLKRKLNESVGKPLLKNAKLDSFGFRKSIIENKNDSDASLDSLETTNTTETSKDIFSFHNTARKTGKSSKSLFAGIQDRVKQHSSSLPEKNSSESASLIPDSLKSTGDTKMEQRRRSTRSLFTKPSMESSGIDSPILFSSHAEDTSEPSSARLASKRKLSDPELGPSTNKKSNKSSNLFGFSPAEKKGKEVVCMDSDEIDNAFNSGPSKWTFPAIAKRNTTMPTVIVPTTVNLSNFIEVHSKKLAIKKELEEDISSEIKDMLNKTVLHSIPMIKAKSSPMPNEKFLSSGTNFKKFHKNLCSKPTAIIPVTSLVRFALGSENKI